MVASRQARISRSNRQVDAYGDVLRFAHHTMRWVERTKPMLSFSGDSPPESPSMEDQVNARTTMLLFGSARARSAFMDFMAKVMAFTTIVNEMVITDAENASGRRLPEDRNLWMELHTARGEVMASFDAMANVMSEEAAPTPRRTRMKATAGNGWRRLRRG